MQITQCVYWTFLGASSESEKMFIHPETHKGRHLCVVPKKTKKQTCHRMALLLTAHSLDLLHRVLSASVSLLNGGLTPFMAAH